MFTFGNVIFRMRFSPARGACDVQECARHACKVKKNKTEKVNMTTVTHFRKVKMVPQRDSGSENSALA